MQLVQAGSSFGIVSLYCLARSAKFLCPCRRCRFHNVLTSLPVPPPYERASKEVVGFVSGDTERKNSFVRGSLIPNRTWSECGFVIRICSAPMTTLLPFWVTSCKASNLKGNFGEIRVLVKLSCTHRPFSSRAVTLAVPTFSTKNLLPAAVTWTAHARMSVQSASSNVAQHVAPESRTSESRAAYRLEKLFQPKTQS